MNATDKFIIEITDLNLDLSVFSEETRARVESMLRVLQDDLVAEITKADLEGATENSRRFKALLREVDSIIDGRYAVAAERLGRGLRDASIFTHRRAVASFNKVFQVDIFRPLLTQADLKALANTENIIGGLQDEYWKEYSDQAKRRFVREMRLGIGAGETNEELIRRIRGGPTGRTINVQTGNNRVVSVPEYSGGIMDTSYNEARRLVRTATLSVGNAALMETYDQFEEVLKGYEAVTTLDHRTSDICMARTGAAWNLDGSPMAGSTATGPFPGPPPWHWHCRTVLAPVVKTWDELIQEAGGKPLGIEDDTVPDSVRASFDGLVSTGKIQTFDDFLKLRGDEWARSKLGPTKYRLWESGKITTQDLIDSYGRSRTVAELMALAA